MGIYELDISWAATANELRGLHWALLTCERVRGVFPIASSGAFAVLFDGDRPSFAAWARTLEPGLEEALP